MASQVADLLRAEIARLYPQQLAEGYRAYRIVFELAGEEDASQPNHFQQRMGDV